MAVEELTEMEGGGEFAAPDPLETPTGAGRMAAAVLAMSRIKLAALDALAYEVGRDRLKERCEALGEAIENYGQVGLETIEAIRLATVWHRAGATDQQVDRILGAIWPALANGCGSEQEIGEHFSKLIAAGEDVLEQGAVSEFLATIPRADEAAEKAFGCSDAGAITSLAVTADVFLRELIWRGYPRLDWKEASALAIGRNYPLEKFYLSGVELILGNCHCESDVVEFFEGLHLKLTGEG